MSGRHELRALTSARGIAAWFVVFYHIRLGVAGLPARLVAVFAKGYLAVDFFFLLSGFVIWLSWGERLRAEGLAAAPRFLQRRIARVWPLHAFMLACALALVALLAATGRAIPGFPLAELPLHILLVQNWGFTRTLTWNYPAWSISCELAAYLLFPLLALAIDWRRVPVWAVLGAVAALFVLLAALMVAAGAQDLGEDIARLGMVRCLLEFAAGTALCALWLRWRARPFVPAMAALAVAGAMLMLCALGVPEALAVPPAFAALLLALALASGRRGNPLDGRVPHALGEISYATYLGHYLLFQVFKLVLVDDPRAIPPLLIALYLALVLAASVALYHLVERPAQRRINALAGGTRPRPDALAPRRSAAWKPSPSNIPTTAMPASPAGRCATAGDISRPTAPASPTAPRSNG